MNVRRTMTIPRFSALSGTEPIQSPKVHGVFVRERPWCQCWVSTVHMWLLLHFKKSAFNVVVEFSMVFVVFPISNRGNSSTVAQWNTVTLTGLNPQLMYIDRTALELYWVMPAEDLVPNVDFFFCNCAFCNAAFGDSYRCLGTYIRSLHA